jgi:hypothetical protein
MGASSQRALEEQLAEERLRDAAEDLLLAALNTLYVLDKETEPTDAELLSVYAQTRDAVLKAVEKQP